MSSSNDIENPEVSEDGTNLVYRKNYTAASIHETLGRRRLRGLFVNSILKRDLVPDLSFLRECSFLRSLSIISRIDYDFTVLRHLSNLEDLGIRCPLGENPIALGELSKLQRLNLWWRPSISALRTCGQLTETTLWDVRADDISSPELAGSTRKLSIQFSAIRALNGIERATELETLFVGGCPRRADIDAPAALPSLRHVTFSSCPKISRRKAQAQFGPRIEMEFISAR